MEKVFFWTSLVLLVFLILAPLANAEVSITAASGSAADIQTAVDQVVAAGGIGDVHIPEGDFACDIDTSLGPNPPPFSRPYAVLIPGGVSIIGQGIGKTILRQTAEPVNLGNMFIIDGRNGLRIRISGITFIGAPFSVEGEPAYTNGIYMHGATDFRIDHCHFENWNSKAISCSNTYEGAWGDNRGVIDHCNFDNTYKDDPDIEGAGTSGRKVWGYGIIPGGKGIDQPTDYYLGKYDGLEDIVYIEDCNFSRTRHAIASNSYGWYVVRNSRFYEPRPEHYPIIDVHGFNFGRGLEAYNNEIYGCEYKWNGTDEVSTGRWLSIAFGIRGGGGVIFNNSLIDINRGITLSDESPESGEGRIDDLWIWDNSMITQDAPSGYTGDDGTYILPAEFMEGVEYHLAEMPGYTPYPYPHPLTIEPSNKHRFWGTLLDKYGAAMESEISFYNEDTETVITSSQTDASGDYDMNIQPGVFDIGYRILDPSFYVPNFYLRLRSINVSAPLQNLVKSITSYPTEKRIGVVLNASAKQRIRTHSQIKPARVRINGSLLSEVTDISNLKDNTWYYDSAGQRLHMIVSPLVSVIAASGSAADIQTAVDQIVAAGGIGDVHVPEGTFNFYEPGETWEAVEVPVGVNIFGAPTQRDADDQVVEWKTKLVMPFEALDGSVWFKYEINDNIPFRFSDLKLIGYRYYNVSSETMYTAISINGPYTSYPDAGVLDFRIDHCDFQDMCGSALYIGPHAEHNRRVYRGIIDHNILNNTYGDPGFMRYEERTLGYGIGVRRWASDFWDHITSNVVGHYNNYTIFIEDNYFSKWRHSVASNDGIHYVFRHNIVDGDYATASIDGHGSYADDSHSYAVGTRAIEAYENMFRDPDTTWTSVPWAINHRGGAGIFFNNTLEGYYALMDLNNDWGNYDPYCPHCRIYDTYIWDNELGGGKTIKYNSDSQENVHYFLRPPSMAEDGFEYTPYPYPHPLTLED
jgi:hypothetical protein